MPIFDKSIKISLGILLNDSSGRLKFGEDERISTNVSIDFVDLLLNNFSI
jgi:hypothetical protein